MQYKLCTQTAVECYLGAALSLQARRSSVASSDAAGALVSGVYALLLGDLDLPYIGKAIDVVRRYRTHLNHLAASAETDQHRENCCIASYAIARAAFRGGAIPELRVLELHGAGALCNLGAMEYAWWSRLHGPDGWQHSPYFASPCFGECDHLEVEEYLAVLSKRMKLVHASRSPVERREHALRIHINMTAEQRGDITKRSNAARTPERRREISQSANAAQPYEVSSARQTEKMAKRTSAERSAIIALGHARKSAEQLTAEAKHRWSGFTAEQRFERLLLANASRTLEARKASAVKRAASRTPETIAIGKARFVATVYAKTPDERSAQSRRAAASQTPEQRSAKAVKANASRTPEQRAASQQKAWATRRAKAGTPAWEKA